MDPVSILKLALTVWKSGGTIIEFVKNFRAHAFTDREETPEEAAAFDKAIDEMDKQPYAQPDQQS